MQGNESAFCLELRASRASRSARTGECSRRPTRTGGSTCGTCARAASSSASAGRGSPSGRSRLRLTDASRSGRTGAVRMADVVRRDWGPPSDAHTSPVEGLAFAPDGARDVDGLGRRGRAHLGCPGLRRSRGCVRPAGRSSARRFCPTATSSSGAARRSSTAATRAATVRARRGRGGTPFGGEVTAQRSPAARADFARIEWNPQTRRRKDASCLSRGVGGRCGLLALFGVGLAGAIVGRAPAAGARAAAVQKLHVLAPGPGDIAVTTPGRRTWRKAPSGPGGR